MERFIITVARETGSGGHNITRKLSDVLGVPYYDRDLLRKASEVSGIHERLFGEADERIGLREMLTAAEKVYTGEILPPDSDDYISTRNLFSFQAKIIKELADSESCIILGRCGNYLLADHPHVLRVFIHAPLEARLARVASYSLAWSHREVARHIRVEDHRRAAYYRYYTGEEWRTLPDMISPWTRTGWGGRLRGADTQGAAALVRVTARQQGRPRAPETLSVALFRALARTVSHRPAPPGAGHRPASTIMTGGTPMNRRLQLEYLFKDRPYDPNVSPADYDMLCAESGGARIYGEILWPDGGFAEPRPCVLLSHGYPGVARNDDLAFALRRIGCVVVVLHHRGAWGSEGQYLVSHCVEDVIRVYEQIRSPAFCQQYCVDPNAIFLAGHSMGGNSVLQAARRAPGRPGADPAGPLRPHLAPALRPSGGAAPPAPDRLHSPQRRPGGHFPGHRGPCNGVRLRRRLSGPAGPRICAASWERWTASPFRR